MRKIIFTSILLLALTNISIAATCGNHPALARFKNLTNQFIDNSNVSAFAAEALTNFETREAGTPLVTT